MIYTPLTKKAACIAYAAHAGQKDKAGMPYIFHPYHLAEQMTGEAEVCAALLHDVAEDTDVTLDDLVKEFPQEIVEALRLLTHAEGEDYFEYVRRLRKNPIARAVKLADLRHNSDLTRLDAGTPQYEKAAERNRSKYAKALRILSEENE